MCTVTFLPTDVGFIVAMNRDDLYVRAETAPPTIVTSGLRKAIYPSEMSGGTWIGANDAGLALCLLNWHHPAGLKRRSRGTVIPNLLSSQTLNEVEAVLSPGLLGGTLPFRLLGASSEERKIHEWRWTGSEMSTGLSFAWELNHWFSSGLSDELARQERSCVCKNALTEEDAFSIDWLRRLHRSHLPEPGAFSICAHREQGGTLSYTEVHVSTSLVRVHYTDSRPCEERPMTTADLRRTSV